MVQRNKPDQLVHNYRIDVWIWQVAPWVRAGGSRGCGTPRTRNLRLLLLIWQKFLCWRLVLSAVCPYHRFNRFGGKLSNVVMETHNLGCVHLTPSDELCCLNRRGFCSAWSLDFDATLLFPLNSRNHVDHGKILHRNFPFPWRIGVLQCLPSILIHNLQ